MTKNENLKSDIRKKAAIIGTGNIGVDLLVKVLRSPYLECSLFAGRNYESVGMKYAARLGVPLTDRSIEAIEENPDICDIVFDATSAAVHLKHAPILEKLGKFTIDLTPSLVGSMCVPMLNLDECLTLPNVNLITCGGQATVPIAKALSDVHDDIEYLEIVSSISSKSAGPGTRANIDEFTQTTKEALRIFTKIPETKAIITLNPAEPPILMRNTIYAKISNPNMEEITAKIKRTEETIQKYVPGYKVILGPVFENGRVTTMVQVTGLGDYLPVYSGNLDIITCAAIKVAEEYVLCQNN